MASWSQIVQNLWQPTLSNSENMFPSISEAFSSVFCQAVARKSGANRRWWRTILGFFQLDFTSKALVFHVFWLKGLRAFMLFYGLYFTIFHVLSFSDDLDVGAEYCFIQLWTGSIHVFSCEEWGIAPIALSTGKWWTIGTYWKLLPQLPTDSRFKIQGSEEKLEPNLPGFKIQDPEGLDSRCFFWILSLESWIQRGWIQVFPDLSGDGC